MKNIKIFSDNIEEEAIRQFNEAMALPCNIQGALMPDAHAGYTLPIGAVVKSKGFIFPSYVGYDIGCTDRDTEYLTRQGWVKICDYVDEEILEYDVTTDTASFAKPLAYIKKECNSFNYFSNKNVNQMLSDEHKVLLFQGTKSRGYKPVDYMASLLIDKHNTLKKGIQGGFKTTFHLNGEGIPLSDMEIRLQVAISADATLRNRKTQKDVVEFHLKKQRKIDRLLFLLDTLNITPNIHQKVDGNFSCSFTPPIATKSLNMFWAASEAQLKILAEEVKLWDGNVREGGFSFSSNKKEDIDLVQYAFAVSGVRTGFHKIEYKEEHQVTWNPTYQLYSSKNEIVMLPNAKDITRVSSEDGKSYCFTTKTGYWIQRRAGKISITGNCGMCAIALNLRKEDLDLVQLRDYIVSNVPLGSAKHSAKQNINLDPKAYDLDEFTFTKIEDTGVYQIGTLGGGNHFIEIGESETEKTLWIVIHSGSRGLGYKIADHFMNLAAQNSVNVEDLESEFIIGKEIFKNVNPERYAKAFDTFIEKQKNKVMKNKEGHYGFELGSDLANKYINAMNYCLDFALENRKTIIENIIKGIEQQLGRKIETGLFINRNHNHAEIQGEFIVHRKGATHAEDGMYGVIPANMKDGSFIVKGRGNPLSMCSSSHGAGRVLSRTKAKETLDLNEFHSSMQGVVTNHTDATLDESPKAYKDIFEVMEMQKDLVKIYDRSIPILNIKG